MSAPHDPSTEEGGTGALWGEPPPGGRSSRSCRTRASLEPKEAQHPGTFRRGGMCGPPVGGRRRQSAAMDRYRIGDGTDTGGNGAGARRGAKVGRGGVGEKPFKGCAPTGPTKTLTHLLSMRYTKSLAPILLKDKCTPDRNGPTHVRFALLDAKLASSGPARALTTCRGVAPTGDLVERWKTVFVEHPGRELIL